MRIIFSAFFLFHVSLCREGPCPKSIRKFPQYHLNLTDNLLGTVIPSGTCLPVPCSGDWCSANWWGVASSIFSMVPVIGPVYGGLLGIIANSGITSNSAGYGDNFNDCIKQMMRREIEITQFGTAQEKLAEIGRHGNNFKRDINGIIDEFQLDQTIYHHIHKVADRVDNLKDLFLSDTNGYMQAQFVQLFLDGLAMESLLRLTFLTRLKELNYDHYYFCRHINHMRDEMSDRYDYFFETIDIYKKLHASRFSEWPDSIFYKSTYCSETCPENICYCYGESHQEVRDQYTANTTHACTIECGFWCSHSCTDPEESIPIEKCNEARDFVDVTMTNIDIYFSNAKETQQWILQYIKDIGHNISCHMDLTTTTPAISSVDPMPSPSTPSNVGSYGKPTLEECVQAMRGLHDYFTSEGSLNEQTDIFITNICMSNQIEDETTCTEHFGKFYASAAPCLHDSFFSEPEILCERISSSNIELKSRELSCDWCIYYMEALAYLWTQPEALDNGLSILYGECFCSKDGMDADYPNCHEEVDLYYPICLTVGGYFLVQVAERECQDALDVC